MLISRSRAYIVDWAWACKGAAWAELAMVAFRLMAAGHTIQSAQEWGRASPAWEDGKALNGFVSENARTWQQAAERDPQDWKVRAARIAQQWASHRKVAVP